MGETLKKLLKMESAAGIILIHTAILAMILANSGLASYYHSFLEAQAQIRVGSLDINKPLLLWINDGLMALFFLYIGLEVKREMMEGALSSRAKATFPAIAAIGGMLAPALLYIHFNYDNEITRAGWAIPAATDIAFALGVMALLGKRVPTNLKVFLLALAIMDDLGVIIIIALFYTQQLSLYAIGIAALATALLFALNRLRVDNISLYMFIGVIAWVAVLKSGVHATLAGVIVALMIPMKGKNGSSPLKELEHKLSPWCAYFILPLFAFANAGVSLEGVKLSSLSNSVSIGIIAGLVVGKPIGIFTISWLAVKLKVASLPPGINFKQIFAVSILCGIGFTMSMFIASLAFEYAGMEYDKYARLGILIGSSISAVIGYTMLRYSLPKEPLPVIEERAL